ncbi:glycine C-acetyltransferase [Brevirhabdus sp.]|uniref:glycine C-acetyltransferase n=1 Tax=Brevirhabdus sp. TaxID=2004514 RepID=UPI0040588E6A
MSNAFLATLRDTLTAIDAEGLTKRERLITSPQGARIEVAEDAAGDAGGNRNENGGGREVINLCANNYLGLADHPELIDAAARAMRDHGFGMASVRFICGTQDLHRQLESALAGFLGTDDAILFAACFDANGGLFEPLLGPEDAVISDALNHASIIDGIRLCKAQRYRYANNDMTALEEQLKAARAEGARNILIATDGVFSMDGYLADLPAITTLARRYDAMVMVDDCHATGFMGPAGEGTPAHHGVKVDILTGTLGKALGGALGGYVAGPQPVIDLLRQRARPYLFSNALPPAITAAGLRALELVRAGDDLRARLFDNAAYWRQGLTGLGFDLLPGEHPIIPVMLGEAKLAQRMASALFDEGVYASGFFFPVVPKGQARIRTQMSAALTRADLDAALEAFSRAGKATGVLA